MIERDITSFEARVYEATCLIPRGMVTTYATIGRIIGCRSPRAIGQALRRNPTMPVVPGHGVISSDLTLGGYCGVRAGPLLEQKRRLLKAEGVVFVDDRLAKESQLWSGL
jgi:methylated-DNA-[protein]-cysteine S-methyltransferase